MKEYFPKVKPIAFSEDKFTKELCFRRYKPDEVVGGKAMKQQLKFSMAYWHTLCGAGGDPFGPGTAQRP